MKSTMFLVLTLLLASLSPVNVRAETQDKAGVVVNLRGLSCPKGIHKQSGGPFAVLVSCEDALGSYLGVLYYVPMGASGVAKWSLADRFWQEPIWSHDVTSYIWSNDGKSLYVTTSGVYGEAGVYCVDLFERKSVRLYPKVNSKEPTEDEYQLKSADFRKGSLLVTHEVESKTETITVPLPRR